MQFLKTLVWVVIAVAAVMFSMRNWTPVPIDLWPGFGLIVKLPLLLLFAILLGLLPTLVIHYTKHWRLRRRLDSAERSLAEAQTPAGAAQLPQQPILP